MNVKHCMFRNYKILFQILTDQKKKKRNNFKLKLNKKYIINAVRCNMLLVAQLCLTLCDPMDCSLPGSSVHGILQARIPEWFATPSFGRSFQPRN